jgi:hypothetical protein
VDDTLILTLTTRNSEREALSYGGASVECTVEREAEAGDGTLSDIVDHENGTYSTTFTATASGTEVIVACTVDSISSSNSVHLSVLSVSGLLAWYDVDAMNLTEGSTVTDWLDQSSNKNNATAPDADSSATYRAALLNGRSVLQLDGNDSYDILGSAVSRLQSGSGMSVFIVTRSNLPDSRQYLFATHEVDGQNLARLGLLKADADLPCTGSDRLTRLSGLSGPNHDKCTANVDTWSVFTGIWGTTRKIFRHNKLELINESAANEFSSIALVAIGQEYDKSPLERSEWLDGEIAEFIIFDRELDSQEANTVEDYLRKKYALW